MLTVIRTKEGKSRWLTTSSTYFKDRDKEIVSEKALAADVERADADGDYGPLRWWHVKGLDIGTCDFNEVRDGMLIESGTFHNEAIARAVEKEAPNLGVSIGFTHPADQPDAQGVFHDIRRYERSLLPLGSASNPYTTFSVKEKGMAPNTPERAAKKWRAFVDTVFEGDEDSAKAYAEQISARAEEIKSSGVAFKETRTEKGDSIVKKLSDLSTKVKNLWNDMNWTDDDALQPVASLVSEGARSLMNAERAFSRAAVQLSDYQMSKRAGINKEASEKGGLGDVAAADLRDAASYLSAAILDADHGDWGSAHANLEECNRGMQQAQRYVARALAEARSKAGQRKETEEQTDKDYYGPGEASLRKARSGLDAAKRYEKPDAALVAVSRVLGDLWSATEAARLRKSDAVQFLAVAEPMLEEGRALEADLKRKTGAKESTEKARPTRVEDRDPLASLFTGEGA